MTRRIIALISLLAFLNNIFGCATTTTSTKIVSRNQAELEPHQDKIVAVTRTSGDVITFDSRGGELDVVKKLVWGSTQDGALVMIQLDDVQYLHLQVQDKRIDTARTVGCAIMCVVVGIAVLAIMIIRGFEGSLSTEKS